MTDTAAESTPSWTSGHRLLVIAIGVLALAILAYVFGRGLLGGSTGASTSASTAPVAAKLALDAELPDTIPPGTRLVIGDPTTQRVLKHTGWDQDLPFEIAWANIAGGPAVTEGWWWWSRSTPPTASAT